MSHKINIFDRLRHRYLPIVGRLLERTGLDHDGWYVEAVAGHEEFSAVVNMSVTEFEKHITHGHGFNENPLAALKTHDGDHVEQGSWAWRGRVTQNNWFPDAFAPMQLHVMAFELDGDEDTTALFAHWEDNWIVSPWKHYRGHNFDSEKGVELLREFLSMTGVDYEIPNRT